MTLICHLNPRMNIKPHYCLIPVCYRETFRKLRIKRREDNYKTVLPTLAAHLKMPDISGNQRAPPGGVIIKISSTDHRFAR